MNLLFFKSLFIFLLFISMQSSYHSPPRAILSPTTDILSAISMCSTHLCAWSRFYALSRLSARFMSLTSPIAIRNITHNHSRSVK